MPRGIFGDVPLPSGARGYLLGEQTAQQNTNNQLSQFATLLGLQNSMQTMPLQRQLLQEQVNQAQNPAALRIDTGGAIELRHPRTYQLLGTLPKTASPDAQLRETRADQRHATPSGSAVMSDTTARRGQDMSAATAATGQAITLQGQQQPVWDPERGVFVPRPLVGAPQPGQPAPVIAPPGLPPRQKEAEKKEELDRTIAAYTAARDGLMAGLEGSSTGPVVGRMPAVTSAQQVAGGGVSAMAPVLKQIFRVAGEGTFTDKDQQMLLDMLPTRADKPEARVTKMQNIDNIISAKLGRSVSRGQAPSAPAGWSIRPLP